MYGVLLVPFPQDLVTHVSKQQSIENFQTFYFVMKMKASDNLNQVKLSARAHSNFQTSLLSEDGGRFKKMEGEGGEGVTPIYIYSTIVIWLNIVMFMFVFLSASSAVYIYLTNPLFQ